MCLKLHFFNVIRVMKNTALSVVRFVHTPVLLTLMA